MDVKTTVRELAALVGGTVVGDGDVPISSAGPLSNAGPNHVSFVEDAKHLHALEKCPVAALITRPGIHHNGIPVIEVDDPLGAFLTVFRHFHRQPEPPPAGVDSRAYVHPTAKLGAGVSLQPFVSIGEGSVIGDRCRLYPGVVVGRNCTLGNDVTLLPNVVVYDGCKLGHRVIVHANSVVGSDGFGYRYQGGRHHKVPQLGNVEIGDDVELGACTTIDRGTFQATRIGEGTKMDNHVQVAHNCRVGKHNLFAAHTALAGSCSSGDYVVLAGQVGIADHVHLGDGVVVGAQAGVTHSVKPGEQVLGSPAMPAREAKSIMVHWRRLPEMRKDLQEIKKHLGMDGKPN
jgi:UDP-3-O-[3-hydroxymyristoyl] glucosamine N-acyltransferase